MTEPQKSTRRLSHSRLPVLGFFSEHTSPQDNRDYHGVTSHNQRVCLYLSNAVTSYPWPTSIQQSSCTAGAHK